MLQLLMLWNPQNIKLYFKHITCYTIPLQSGSISYLQSIWNEHSTSPKRAIVSCRASSLQFICRFVGPRTRSPSMRTESSSGLRVYRLCVKHWQTRIPKNRHIHFNKSIRDLCIAYQCNVRSHCCQLNNIFQMALRHICTY